MPKVIILRLTSRSEKDFFSIVQENRLVSLKHFYKKINSKQAFAIVKRLDALQNFLGAVIFTKKTDFCQYTGRPISSLQFNVSVEIRELNKEIFAVISVG